MDDVESRCGPPALALVGVDLGATRIGIIEITPRQHMKTPHAMRT